MGRRATVDLPVASIGPHPMNAPERSQPQPGAERWEQLVAGVREQGVLQPVLVVTRDALIAARPELADAVGSYEHVLIYGHRRRAAAIAAGRDTIPATVDDSYARDNRDLVAMAIENLGREDLTPLQQALTYQQLMDVGGRSQRALARELGVNQAVISRRLALLRLGHAAREAVEAGRLPVEDAATLAAQFPHAAAAAADDNANPGTAAERRRRDEAQQHAEDQEHALRLVMSGSSVSQAAERVRTERQARRDAADQGLSIIEPVRAFGASAARHRLYDVEEIDAAREARTLVVAIDDRTGELQHYTTRLPETSEKFAEDSRRKDEARRRREAQQNRRDACVAAVADTPGRDLIAGLVTTQYLHGVTAIAGRDDAFRLAHDWLSQHELADGAVDEWREEIATTTDRSQRQRAVWSLALAGAELRLSTARHVWDGADRAYLELLQARAGYELTAWERQQLDQPATGTENA